MTPKNMRKKISILGATGSIGDSCFKVIRQHTDRYQVEAITAHSNISKLAARAVALDAKMAVIARDDLYADLKDALSGTNIAVGAGPAAMLEAAGGDADTVVAAIVGSAGLAPVMAAVDAGKTIALANKECLVCGGDLVMARARETGAVILPLDSEHSALFQALAGSMDAKPIRKMTITASGGPFLARPLDTFDSITPEEAVAHPKWSMGAKISVDSATMMNKGLEIIEAYHLFPVGAEQLEAVIHPQSVIHGLVEFIDGSSLAQLGHPDMQVPVAHCLGWPDRISTDVPSLDLAQVSQMTFEAMDRSRFPCFALAERALAAGGTAPLVLNAANEAAVAAFLARQISYPRIAGLVEATLEAMQSQGAQTNVLQSLADVYALDAEARAITKQYIHAA